MPLSAYCRIFPLDGAAADFLLFSTRTAAKALVNRETLRRLKQGLLSPPAERSLRRLGFLVPDPAAEKESVIHMLDHQSSGAASWLRLVVVLNLDCNFSCAYCFEDPHKGRLYMSRDTAATALRFIKGRFRDSPGSLFVDFYGGEPLLSLPLIKTMATDLKTFFDHRKTVFKFSLITNGARFTRRIAKQLVPLGLSHVKFTVDGPRHIHDIQRPFKNGRGSFAVLLKNLKATWDLVNIGLGCNYTREKYREFPALLAHLAAENLGPDRIRTVRFSPVISTAAVRARSAMVSGCASSSEPWLAEADLHLRGALLQHGYQVPAIRPVICTVERENAAVIHYNGELYKCPGFTTDPAFAVGDVHDGFREDAAAQKPRPWQNAECEECVYLPLCFGGCRYMSYLAGKGPDQPDCHKAYWEASLSALVLQEVRHLKRLEGSAGR